MTFDGVVFTLTMLFFYGALGLYVVADYALRKATQNWKAAMAARDDAKQFYIDTLATLDEYQFHLDRVQRRGEV